MPQAADCDLFLYADNGCLLYQHEDLDQINKELTKTFCDICDWFVGNKLSIHFGEDKTKYVRQHQYQRILKSNILKL